MIAACLIGDLKIKPKLKDFQDS